MEQESEGAKPEMGLSGVRAAVALSGNYGCDRCGHSKAEHTLQVADVRHRPHKPGVEILVCPGAMFSAAKWCQHAVAWVDDGHMLGGQLRGDTIDPVIICGDRCTPLVCECAHEEYGRKEPDPKCPDCGGAGVLEGTCMLRVGWWEQDPLWCMEQTLWALSSPLTLPTPILWWGSSDDFNWRPRGALA